MIYSPQAQCSPSRQRITDAEWQDALARWPAVLAERERIVNNTVSHWNRGAYLARWCQQQYRRRRLLAQSRYRANVESAPAWGKRVVERMREAA